MANTTLSDSLVQIRRILYAVMRDRRSGARAADTPRHLSRSIRWVLQPTRPARVCQSLRPGAAQRQRTEVDAADARPSERSRVVPRAAAFRHALDVGGAAVLAAAAGNAASPDRHSGDRRNEFPEAREVLRRRRAAVLRRARQGGELPGRGVDGAVGGGPRVADHTGTLSARGVARGTATRVGPNPADSLVSREMADRFGPHSDRH